MKTLPSRITRRAIAGGVAAYALVVGSVLLPAQGGIDQQQQAIEPLIRGPQSLKGVAVPEPPNLGDFVMDRQSAIVLGKALVWDMKAGSGEIQACARSHFHDG